MWEPVPGISLGADWFYLDVENIVTNGVPIATILDPALYATYSELVTRAPTCAGGQPCPITAIDQRFVNIGRTKIQGIDVDARFNTLADRVRPLQRHRDGHVLHQVRRPAARRQLRGLRLQRVPGGGHRASRRAGRATSPGPGTCGPWSATLGNTYQSSYTDVQTDPDGNLRRVGSLSLWDLQGSYTGFKNFTLTLGVKNLLDTDPPLTNSNLTFQCGYDPSYYDPRARFVYGSVRYAFN